MGGFLRERFSILVGFSRKSFVRVTDSAHKIEHSMNGEHTKESFLFIFNFREKNNKKNMNNFCQENPLQIILQYIS